MRTLVTGGAGMLGSCLADVWPDLRPDDEFIAARRSDVDLRDRAATRAYLEHVKPDRIIHAAARVGGAPDKVKAPTGYLLDNLLLDSSVLSGALDLRIPELLYVSSAAIYPADYERPFVESDILSGKFDDVNEGYAIAKVAGLKVCEYASREFGLAYRSVVPSNLYGIHDHFDQGSAHLVAAALGKVHHAKTSGSSEVVVWGDGTARREFTFAGDVAAWIAASIGSIGSWPATVNVGCGTDNTVREYYEIACDVVGFDGSLSFDESKPAGAPRRLLDSSVARQLGWAPTTTLTAGIAATYASYLARLGG